ncbi:MAG: glycosyltransferase [Rhodospirillales bacterium]|nr:glycosyltransferase [Rhodospirillales bacterium]
MFRRVCRSRAMHRALRLNVPKFDVLHLHSIFLWPTTAAAVSARMHRKPYVLTTHGMLVPDLIWRKNWMAKMAWISLFERRNIENAEAIHFTSQHEEKEFRALRLKHRRAVVIPNIVDPPHADDLIKSGGNWLPNSRFILFLGRVSQEKGLDRLIPAMAAVRDADLVIVGNDEEEYQRSLKGLAFREGVADRVHFLGPVHGPEKWSWLRAAAMLVLPSYSENFGMVVLEAMAVGCPVVGHAGGWATC